MSKEFGNGTTKPCATCKKELPREAFHKNSKHNDGFQTNCRACVKDYGHRHYEKHKKRYAERLKIYFLKNRAKVYARAKAWAERNKGKIASKRAIHYRVNRERILKRQRLYRYHPYNLSVAQFNAIKRKQRNRCRICDRVLKRPYVDHDHACCKGSRSCGKCVRGLLCFNCNTFLGHAKDNVRTLEQAILYLKASC